MPTPKPPDLAALSPEQIAELEKTLTNFITNIKQNGRLPEALLRMRMADAEHSSHAQR